MDSETFADLDRAMEGLRAVLIEATSTESLERLAAGDYDGDVMVNMQLSALLGPLLSAVIALAGAVDELRATVED